MSEYKFWPICWLLLMPTVAAATEQQALKLTLSQNAGAELQLEARQQFLPRILKKMTEATGVPIHYSVLPQETITATCAGTTVKQVLECLFDKKADLVFRYAKHRAKEAPQHRLEEVWVLGTDFAAEGAFATAGMPVQNPAATTHKNTGDTDETDDLLELIKTEDPGQRADAVARLAAEGQTNNERINGALLSALSDKNAEVRAQAVFGLVKRESDDAQSVLQNAMQDSATSVRLMAVDSAGDNAALLQQALRDNDGTVRAYAATKLEALAGTGKIQ